MIRSCLTLEVFWFYKFCMMIITRFFFVVAASLLFQLSSLSAAPSEPEETKPKEVIPAERVAFDKGYSLLKKKRYAQAQTYFEKAIKLKHEFPEAHNNLAYVLRKQSSDNFAIAEKHYNIALTQNPKLAQAYAYRGALYTLQGEIEKAEKDYQALLALDKKLAAGLRKVIDSRSDAKAPQDFGVSSYEGGY